MRVLLLLVLLPACVEMSDSEQFIGTWAVTTGSSTVTCGPSTMTGAESTPIELEAGTDSDLVQHDGRSPPCTVKYDVARNVATILPEQQCSGTVSSGATVVVTFDMSTMTLADDDSLFLEASGTATSTPPAGGTPVPCAYSRSVTYRRQ